MNKKEEKAHRRWNVVLFYIRRLDCQICCFVTNFNTFFVVSFDDSSNVKFKWLAKKPQKDIISPFWALQQALCTSLPWIDILEHRPNAEDFL